MAIITLTTDFGLRDGYVGAMKGVIARTAPAATIVDIAHDVPRGDIAHAAWVLYTSTVEFPPGSVHLAVVDPGVGSERAAVYGKPDDRDHWYVGPDNGMFAYLGLKQVWQIDASALSRFRVSETFHGRDIFAPVAAMLALDLVPRGRPTRLTATLPYASTSVVHVDHYGNLITNLMPNMDAGPIRIAGHVIPVVRTFSDVAPGALLAYIGSAGSIEVAVRDGRADARLSVTRGEPISFAGEGTYR